MKGERYGLQAISVLRALAVSRKGSERVIVTGSFECPDGHNSDVLVAVRITAPPMNGYAQSASLMPTSRSPR